ncbi:SigE family RNA polymerase sigma factor [Nocardioides sp. 1609]|uniref:SigE family RNA polymerase sigma factor n=1 Tax=Nocardioides sp. 1609 TaxID=2508327 RepID=UPI00106FF966|nr:SigE family RNA polymerase sigma factor [Nocardioides sp. 1609]
MEQDADFADYVSARWEALVRSGVMLGCTLDEAHDLAQTTLLRCYKSWRKVAAAAEPDAYVYRILINCHRDGRRRRWSGEVPTELLPDRKVDDETQLVALRDSVRRAIDELSLTGRQVVVLRYFANLSEAQTANVLNIPLGTVKSRLSRALSQLSDSDHLVEGPSGE